MADNKAVILAGIAGLLALIGALKWSKKTGEEQGWLLQPGQNYVPGAESPSADLDWEADFYQGGMSGGGGASGSFLTTGYDSGSASYTGQIPGAMSEGSIFDQWWGELTDAFDFGGYDTPTTSIGGTVTATLDDIYKKYGKRYGIDWRLIKAHAMVESGENTNAVNPNDPSYGVLQVLCKDDGKGGCSNTLNVDGWPPKNKEQLFDPDYNVKIATQILRWNIQTYGYPKGVAVFNQWSARTAPENGPFPNADYVSKVLGYYDTFTKSYPA